MSCEHAKTTVLLHLFGEAPSWYAGHLARCEECQEALAENAVTVGLVEGVFQDDQVLTMEQEAAPGKVVDLPAPAPSAMRRVRRPVLWAAAAAAVLALAFGATVVSDLADGPATTEDQVVEALPWEDPIDHELDLLDSELDALARDLEEL